MDYDGILHKIGDFGPYQKKLLVLVFLPVIFNAFGGPVSNFLLGIHSHRCSLPSIENDTFKVQSDFHSKLINESIPLTENGEYDSCNIRVNGTKQKCSRWVFDNSIFSNTANSQFQAVCDRKLLTSHATMSFYFGNMVSAVTLCSLSDIIGRRMTTCICLTLVFIVNVVMPFSINMYMLTVMRFFDGFFGMAFYQTTFVIGIEMVGPSKRQLTGTLILLVYCLGEFIMVGVAYFIRDWRWLQLTLAIPMAVTVIYWWPRVLPESPRWLLSRGRTKEAMDIIQRVAKVNKAHFSSDDLLLSSSDQEKKKDAGILVILKKLFLSRVLLLRWAVVFFNWFTISFIYYGIQLNIGQLSGDLYVNFLISIISETIGYSLLLFVNKTGRRRMHLATMFSMTVICVASVFSLLYVSPSYGWITVALAMIGKLLISLAFAVIYIYTGELFPTVVRNTCLGVCSVGARVASLLTPYLYHLTDGKFQKVLPLILYAVTIIIAAALSCLLPETNKKKLIEQINDVDAGEMSEEEYSSKKESTSQL